jgi:hypothetical protein
MKIMQKLFASLALTLSLATTAFAADPLTVDGQLVRAQPPGARVTGAFMTFRNAGADNVEITGVSSPDYGRVEMHLSVVEDGVAKMLPQEKLVVPASGELMLKHGSWHLMLFEPKHAIKAGDQVQLQLQTSAGAMQFTAPVKHLEMHNMNK